MDDGIAIGILLLVFAGPVLLGVLVGMMAWVRPLRIRAQSSETYRLALAFLIGSVALLLAFSISAFLHTQDTYLGWTLENGVSVETEEVFRNAIKWEYFARYLIPPSLQASCITGNAEACELAYNPSALSLEPFSWRIYLKRIGSSAVSALTAIATMAIPLAIHDTHKAGGKLRLPLGEDWKNRFSKRGDENRKGSAQ